MRHTAGPWRADKYCVWAGDKYVAGTMTGLYDDEQEGNAAIIAAAPEMYEVLKKIHDDQDCIQTGIINDTLFDLVKRAVTKAEGEGL